MRHKQLRVDRRQRTRAHFDRFASPFACRGGAGTGAVGGGKVLLIQDEFSYGMIENPSVGLVSTKIAIGFLVWQPRIGFFSERVEVVFQKKKVLVRTTVPLPAATSRGSLESQ